MRTYNGNNSGSTKEILDKYSVKGVLIVHNPNLVLPVSVNKIHLVHTDGRYMLDLHKDSFNGKEFEYSIERFSPRAIDTVLQDLLEGKHSKLKTPGGIEYSIISEILVHGTNVLAFISDRLGLRTSLMISREGLAGKEHSKILNSLIKRGAKHFRIQTFESYEYFIKYFGDPYINDLI